MSQTARLASKSKGAISEKLSQAVISDNMQRLGSMTHLIYPAQRHFVVWGNSEAAVLALHFGRSGMEFGMHFSLHRCRQPSAKI
jgi:hypothetical protein